MKGALLVSIVLAANFGVRVFLRGELVFLKKLWVECLDLGVRVNIKGGKFENFIHWGFGGGSLGVMETHGRP